ncbi:citrate synthase [Streptomyces phaeochromogenes]|uniref:citrate/2-methylcitrate synthase n=1 Tax=Streptomyces phaeochromogenes TaxID=1923 RepID=UPI002790BE48|nr:citrate/2-methylcitrate synthase [Streptomyces phaeochromogenes]MDQ0946973.1 citrate synthase [Streptomyces phaeochromogenes]
MTAGPQDGLVAQWWATAVSRVEPGIIELREHPVQDLIGHATFVETIWLMLRGELPRPEQAGLLEAALVAGVDHGPQAPSIAAARMAATCGVGLNSRRGHRGEHAR